jgi:hypothetical protein
LKPGFQFLICALAFAPSLARADASPPTPTVSWRERCVTRLQRAVAEGYPAHTFLGPAMAVREGKSVGMRLSESDGPQLAAFVDERFASGPAAAPDTWRASTAGRKHQLHVERRRGERSGSLTADRIPKRDLADVTQIFEAALDDCLALPPDPPLAESLCLPVIYQGTQCVVGCGLGHPAGYLYRITVGKCQLSGWVDEHCRGDCYSVFVGDSLCAENPAAMAVMQPPCERTDNPGCVLDGSGCHATRAPKPPSP